MDEPSAIGARKADHISLCRDEDVEARRASTLLDQVRLLHSSLPELDVESIDLGTTLLGRRLRTPLVVTGMTGGIAEAATLNRTLAAAAERHGLAFGVGSQRPMLVDATVQATYAVRDVAPTVTLFANIGAVQAAKMSPAELEWLVTSIGADALCVHLNPAQELIQDHGDRDFRGCLDGIARAVESLSVPVIAKETGCGMSIATLRALRGIGVRAVDVSGAGGTTWVGVEALRGDVSARSVGEVLWDWGVPTAVATAWAVSAELETIASGGVRDGLDAARAIALGARAAGAALPFLRAAADGPAALDAVVSQWLRTLRTVCALVGVPDLDGLRAAPRVIGTPLAEWLRVEG